MSIESHPDPSFTALIKIRDEAAVELAKARKDLEKAKAKVARAETGLATLNDAVARIGGEAESPKSQKDAILEMIRIHEDAGATAQQILDDLAERGLALDAKNPQASVHVAADRLAKDGLIEIIQAPGGKLFKRKSHQTE